MSLHAHLARTFPYLERKYLILTSGAGGWLHGERDADQVECLAQDLGRRGQDRADALTAQADAIAVRVARSASNVRKLCTGRGSPCAGSAHLQAALCVQPGTVWRGHGGTALRLEPDRIVTIEQ